MSLASRLWVHLLILKISHEVMKKKPPELWVVFVLSEHSLHFHCDAHIALDFDFPGHKSLHCIHLSS
jgi:hypothetical protein